MALDICVILKYVKQKKTEHRTTIHYYDAIPMAHLPNSSLAQLRRQHCAAHRSNDNNNAMTKQNKKNHNNTTMNMKTSS
jgi:hypothetical protein